MSSPRTRATRAGLVAALVLVASVVLAAPSGATFAKKYELKVAPSSVAAGGSSVFSVTYKNHSLTKVGSTELSVPGGFQITKATSSRGTVSSTNASKVKITNLNLILGSSFTVTVTATVPCGSPGGTWSAVTKPTNDFSGHTTFDLKNPGSAQKTKVTGSCKLLFVNQPQNAGAGATINPGSGVTVKALNGSSQPIAGVPVSMAANGPGSLSGTSPVTTTGSPAAAAFTDLSVDKNGTYTLKATAPGFAHAVSKSFTVADASLGCGPGQNEYSESGAAGTADLTRQTGACNQAIPVSILIRDDEVELQKPFVPGSAFRMTIEWVVETAQNPVPATEIDYDDGFGPHPMEFCLADGGDADPYPDLPPREDGAPGNEFWCITNQQVDLFESGPNAGKLQLTESYFGAGDPKFTRR